MPSASDRTGSPASGPVDRALVRALRWAGDSCRAIVLSGSHATGEAVWAVIGGARVSLSDVDFYACLPDAAACRRAESRALEERSGRAPASEPGLAGPLEVAFLTEHDLRRLPARPGTLEFQRHARVMWGDPAVIATVPRHRPADVPPEEVLLLLENRAFELLAAHARLERATLEGWRARHEVLKCALDLATVLTLEAGEYPDGAAARVALARSRTPVPDAGLPALWDFALAWRQAPAPWDSEAAARDEWRRMVHAWCAVWNRVSAGRIPGEPDPVRRALRLAARAHPRRRLRQALSFRPRTGRGPGAWSRWRFASRGTPQHRLNASATLLLLAANAQPSEAALPAAHRAALRRLGALPEPSLMRFSAAAPAAVERWDRWILDGQRTLGPA